MSPRSAAAILACTLLSSCVVVPVTVVGYDPDCRIVTHQMQLKTVQADMTINCATRGTNNPACLEWLEAAIVTATGSAIVSGSIVVVGNVIYWAEERIGCYVPASPAQPVVTPP
jgi:predicted small integral membrane protein